MPDDDFPHLRRAIELAGAARDAGDEPFGAVLVDPEDRVLGEAGNSQNSGRDPSAHAEMNVLRRLPPDMDLSRSTLYASGEPCPMCAAAIYRRGIARVVFSVSAERFYALRGEPEGGRLHLTCAEVMGRGDRSVEVTGPVLEDEGITAFSHPE